MNNVILPLQKLAVTRCSLSGMFFNPSSVLSQRQERYQEGFRPVTGQDRLNQFSYCSNSSFILWITTSLSVKQHKSVWPCFLSLVFVLHKCASGLGERGQDRNFFSDVKLLVSVFMTSRGTIKMAIWLQLNNQGSFIRYRRLLVKGQSAGRSSCLVALKYFQFNSDIYWPNIWTARASIESPYVMLNIYLYLKKKKDLRMVYNFTHMRECHLKIINMSIM